MEASKEEQRGVVRFLTAEGVGGTDIHRRMSQVYGEHCMSLARVKAWHKRFREGRVSLADDARSGTPHRITDDTVQLVDGLVTQDRRVTVQAIAAEVGLSVGSVHTIIRDRLHWRKVCAQWVPHSLQPQQEACRMAHCLGHLERYARDGNGFLSRVVAGDESWCHHFEPESKRQSLQWKHPGSPPPKKSKAIHTSAGKVMLTFFFDQNGPLLIDFLQHGTTVTAQRYAHTLTALRQAIKSKRPGQLTRGVILLHDNARPHTANAITALLTKFRWEVLGHPPYSPDLSPCDYAIFGPLKAALRGRRFTSDDDVQRYVRNWLTSQPRDFYETAIHRLVSRWDRCLNSQGQYI